MSISDRIGPTQVVRAVVVTIAAALLAAMTVVPRELWRFLGSCLGVVGVLNILLHKKFARDATDQSRQLLG